MFLLDDKTNKIKLLLLIICLNVWIYCVGTTRLTSLSTDIFTPFQHLPIIYFPALIIVCFLTIKPAPTGIKIFSMFVLGLMTIGTLSVIMPYGRVHDSWQNVAIASDIFIGGNFPSLEYTYGYPGSYLLIATVLRVTGLNVVDIVRYMPLFSVIIYIAGTIFLVDNIADLLSIRKNREVAALVFYFIALFGFSLLSLRTNASPQTIGWLLVPFFLGAFIKGSHMVRWRIIAIVIFFLITITHLFSSIVALVMAFSLTFFIERKDIFGFVLLVTISAAWTLYFSSFIIELGINLIKNMFNNELSFAYSTPAAGFGDSPLYTTIRQVDILLVVALLILSLFILFRYRRKLALMLMLMSSIGAIFLIFLFFQGAPFQDRAFLFLSLPLSLFFGFGIMHLFNENEGQSTRGSRWRWIKSASKVFTVVIIIVAGGMSVVTSYQSDSIWMITEPEKKAAEYLNEYTSETRITYTHALPVDSYMNIASRFKPVYLPGIEDMEKLLQTSERLVLITEQWRNWQLSIERKKPTSLEQALDVLEETPQANLVYNNGKSTVYYIKKPKIINDD